MGREENAARRGSHGKLVFLLLLDEVSLCPRGWVSCRGMCDYATPREARTDYAPLRSQITVHLLLTCYGPRLLWSSHCRFQCRLHYPCIVCLFVGCVITRST